MPLDAPVTIATLLDSLLIFTFVLDAIPHTPEHPMAVNRASALLTFDLFSLRTDRLKQRANI
jgi:hypothetical protein